jgi:GxxExxY protein
MTKGVANPIPKKVEHLAREIVDCAFRVHSSLGLGLIEWVYETCLSHELTKRSIGVERQVTLPVVYDGIQLDAGLRLDLRVENVVIVEIKAIERLLTVHEAQLLTYLKLTGLRLGLLVNFNVPRIKDGIRRMVL